MTSPGVEVPPIITMMVSVVNEVFLIMSKPVENLVGEENKADYAKFLCQTNARVLPV